VPNTARTNPYNGAVSVYHPGGTHLVRYLPKDFPEPEQFEVEIAERVRRALTTVRSASACSWGALREGLSAARLEDLRTKDSTEVDAWIAAFDEESAAKDERLEAAQVEIAAAEIKAALGTLRNFGKAERSALEGLGFTVTMGGKHVKAVYRDDERFTFTIPLSASDSRSGKYAASDIVRRLFK